MQTLSRIYENKVKTPSDINEHLPILKKYSEECDVIVEMGVRMVVSTWAFLMGFPKKLISIDYKSPEQYGSNDLELVKQISKDNNIEFEFIQEDSRKVKIQDCDLLFIDTLHTYSQLRQELSIHSSRVKKYIIFHDTETFKYNPDNTNGVVHNERGIWPAIEEFLFENETWVIEEILTNNNGLTVIKRKN